MTQLFQLMKKTKKPWPVGSGLFGSKRVYKSRLAFLLDQVIQFIFDIGETQPSFSTVLFDRLIGGRHWSSYDFFNLVAANPLVQNLLEGGIPGYQWFLFFRFFVRDLS